MARRRAVRVKALKRPLVNGQPQRRTLSRAIRNYIAIHSLVAEIIHDGEYCIWQLVKVTNANGTIHDAKRLVCVINRHRSDEYNLRELKKTWEEAIADGP